MFLLRKVVCGKRAPSNFLPSRLFEEALSIRNLARKQMSCELSFRLIFLNPQLEIKIVKVANREIFELILIVNVRRYKVTADNKA